MSAAPLAVQFVWRNGIPFSRLSKTIVDYFTDAGLRFMRLSVPQDDRSGIFKVTRYQSEPPYEFPHGPWESFRNHKLTFLYELIDRPWEDDPWPKPGIGTINWVVLKDPSLNRWWGEFTVRIEETLRYFNKAMPSKVHHLRMGFEGDFVRPYGETAEEFQVLCQKYHQIKDLYRVLDCDEAFAESPWGIDEKLRQRFPLYRYMDFRVAKEGTQVLVKRMEERRQIPALHWLHSRIFIDPPGVHGLTPEEYAQRGTPSV